MYELDKIVIATQNPSKKERYSRIFSGFVKEVINIKDLGISDKPQESGNTAEENAEIKAKYYAGRTQLPTFSEDEALYVDFLPADQQPGVYVRRINGNDEADDDQLLAHWEDIVAKVPENKRTGKWHFAYSLCTPDGKVKTFTLDTMLLFFSPSSKIRLPGWPMSSLEGAAMIGKPHAEFTAEENASVSQRAEELIREKLIGLFAEKVPT